MNITLSADQKIIAKSRKYAEEHGTSLNNLIRGFLKNISGENDHSANAHEFADLAKNMAGCSPKGYTFDRESIHERNTAE